MSYQMEFSETFDEFAEAFGFKDSEKIYTNGSELIPVFRVRQWLEHDNKLRTIETDTAYECDKHTNTWIPVSERLPEERGVYIVTEKVFSIDDRKHTGRFNLMTEQVEFDNDKWRRASFYEVIAWMPLPEPYKAEMESESEN